MKNAALLAVLAAAVSPLVACGSASSGDGGHDAGPDDGAPRTDAPAGHPGAGPGDGSRPPSDARPEGAADAGPAPYPAFPVDYPQIVATDPTAVMTAPVLVTISFPDDPDVATWEAFGDAIGASSYWTATTSQYGVGAATSGASNHVRMTQRLPKSLSYTQLQKFVIEAITAAEAGDPPDGGPVTDGGAPDPKWPKPTFDKGGGDETIYSLFIPSDTAVTDPGTGKSFCSEGGLGYHAIAKVGGKSIVYSISLECGMTAPFTEETAAHEYVESATDPLQTAFANFDAQHLSWELYDGFQTEVADACQYWQDAYYEDTAGKFPYYIQTVWSNDTATSGHNPCVPAEPGAYYGMTLFPALVPDVTVDLGDIGLGSNVATKGFTATVGTPLTFEVGYFSDGPVAPWTVAYDFPTTTGLYDTHGQVVSNGAATVTIANPTGSNGDKTLVTVTVSAKGGAGFHLMSITWDPPTKSAFVPHYLPILIVDQ